MYSSVLKNRMILYYLAGAGISQLGNVITGLAFLFLSYERTQSSILTTVMAITQAAPYLLFGLAGGVIADSVNKKRLLLLIDIIRVPIILSLVFIYQMNLLGFWHLIVADFSLRFIYQISKHFLFASSLIGQKHPIFALSRPRDDGIIFLILNHNLEHSWRNVWGN